MSTFACEHRNETLCLSYIYFYAHSSPQNTYAKIIETLKYMHISIKYSNYYFWYRHTLNNIKRHGESVCHWFRGQITAGKNFSFKV